MQLEHLMTFQAHLGESHAIGIGPFGERRVARVTGGSFEGPGMKGTILEPGADWVRFTSDGYGQIDVRLVFKTDDAALIYVSYTGLLELNDAAQKSLAGDNVMQFGDAYFATQLRFEVGAERYAHLNQTIAVAEGRLLDRTVEYRCYKVVPSS